MTLLYEEGGAASVVSNAALVERSGLSGTAVTAALKQLAAEGLVAHAPYNGTVLSPGGTARVGQVLRRQRVLELFLATRLGYAWDAVTAEAERLEATASADFVERLATLLGDPRQDPHGAPIPDCSGNWPIATVQKLMDTSPGENVIVRQVVREHVELLRYLATLDLYPGTSVHVVDHVPFNGGVRVRIRGRAHVVAVSVARLLLVEKDDRQPQRSTPDDFAR